MTKAAKTKKASSLKAKTRTGGSGKASRKGSALRAVAVPRGHNNRQASDGLMEFEHKDYRRAPGDMKFSEEQELAMKSAPASNVANYKTIVAFEATLHDRFNAAIIANLYHPLLQYPLPSIHTFGIKRPSVFVQPGGSPVTGLGRFLQRNLNGDPLANSIQPPTPQAAFVDSGYMVTKGRCTQTITLTCPAGASSTYWLWADPLDTERPVRVLQTAINGVGLITFAANAGTVLPWTSTPYLLSRVMVGSGTFADAGKPDTPPSEVEYVGDPAGSSEPLKAWPAAGSTSYWDTVNLYYPGGSILDLEWTNQTAFTSVSMRARGLDNTVHRFFNAVDFSYTASMADTSMDLGFTDNYVSATGATSVYRGTLWDAAMDHGDGTAPDSWAKSLVNGWNGGKHFIQLQLTNVGDSSSSFTFSVNMECWIGTAPLLRSVAGGMEKETVPFDLPNYVDRGVAASSINKNKAKRISNIARDTIARTVANATRDNPVGTEIAQQSNPSGTVGKLLSAGKAGLGAAAAGLGSTAFNAFRSLVMDGVAELPLLFI